MATERGQNRQMTAQEQVRQSPNFLLLFAGMALLGVAFVLLLFGDRLFAEPAPERGVLDHVPRLSAGTLIPTVDSGSEGPAVGEKAPDFSLEDLEGNTVSLSTLRGQPVIINFWATWCGPCRIEMPALQEAYEARQGEGLEVLAVNRDEPATVVAGFFYDELDLTFTPLLDPGATVADLYQVFNLPTTFFVDESGTITAVHRGPLTENQIDAYLREQG